MIDAVLSYHMNGYTCGVAKFNQRLARELRVPMLPFDKHPVAHPLISLKYAEFDFEDHIAWPRVCGWYRTYDLFFHDVPHGLCLREIVQGAHAVYAANAVIADAVREYRPDVITAWCPSTVDGDASRGDIHVLTFGMAHKLALPYYEKLKSLLDDTPGTYTVGLSCAVHEGNPWDQAMHDAEDSLRRLFGLHLRVLGYLADDALVREMDAATAVAAFYDPAFRANNTSAWAVLERGKTLITNTDADSPHSGAQDINQMERWPSETNLRYPLWPYTWRKLVELVEDVACAK